MAATETIMAKLLDQARQLMRTRHYSLRTEESYVRWMKEYIIFHGQRHPATLGAAEVTAFLSYLARNRHVPPRHRSRLPPPPSFLARIASAYIANQSDKSSASPIRPSG